MLLHKFPGDEDYPRNDHGWPVTESGEDMEIAPDGWKLRRLVAKELKLREAAAR